MRHEKTKQAKASVNAGSMRAPRRLYPSAFTASSKSSSSVLTMSSDLIQWMSCVSWLSDLLRD